MYLSHKIKLKPMSNKKENQLRQGYGASRFVWNQVKAMVEEDYKNDIKLPSKFDLGKKFRNKIKPRNPFLQEIPATISEYSVQYFHTAMWNFFSQKSKYPH